MCCIQMSGNWKIMHQLRVSWVADKEQNDKRKAEKQPNQEIKCSLEL